MLKIPTRWRLDTAAINKNAGAIVAQIGMEALSVYRFLRERFAQPNAVADPVFQFVFRSFYRLDNAGLTEQFKRTYFTLLSEQISGSTPDVSSIVRVLHELPNHRGRQTIQFSFSTKLANTVNPEVPVYDSQVARMYGFVAPLWYETFEFRLAAFSKFHQFLKDDYRRIEDANALAPAIAELEQTYGQVAKELSPTKKLDFLIWSAGKTPRV